MKKYVLSSISILTLVIMILFAIMAKETYSTSGCCSHHGGVAGCNDYGKQVCADGTISPTCTCSSGNLTDTSSNNNLTKNNQNCNECIIENEDLNNEINELENENARLKKEEAAKDNWIIILTAGITSYIIYFIKMKKDVRN